MLSYNVRVWFQGKIERDIQISLRLTGQCSTHCQVCDCSGYVCRWGGGGGGGGGGAPCICQGYAEL